MKKITVVLLVVLCLVNALGLTAFAQQADDVSVYVTIADSEGNLAVAQEKVTVSDVDNDGALTVSDALYAAHEVYYTGGAQAGFESYIDPNYGLSLKMLWGTDNGGSYGYCVNNKSAFSLADTVKDGDYVNAYIYTDLSAWSDTYCYFDINTVTAEAGNEITVTLSANGYDDQWNPVVTAVKGAEITLNGEKTGVKTDENGKATITIANGGSYIISAVSDSQTLVPPVLKATVTAAVQENPTVEDTTEKTPDKDTSVKETTTQKSPDTGNRSNIILFTVFVGAILLVKAKRVYEK